MFNIIETASNYFTRDLLPTYLSSEVALYFNLSSWPPYLVVSWSQEVFTHGAIILIIISQIIALVLPASVVPVTSATRERLV